jgi:site-specific DNA recombinase
VVRQIFTLVGRDRCSLAEVCRRLQGANARTKKGRSTWSRQTVWHILQNPAYQGRAAFGKTRMMLRIKNSRLRPRRGQLSEARTDRVAGDTERAQWVFISVPALVKPSLFQAAQQQLHENWSRTRPGRSRPGYLLQGLTCCALCGYAYYGKTTHQTGAGRCFRDFRYYRCSGTDGYRFDGERVCTNPQVRGDLLENAVWREVCKLLNNPRILQQEDQQTAEAAKQSPEIERQRAQLLKLQHGLGRIIDSYAEGLIEKDQFTSRMKQTKARIAQLEGRLSATSDYIDRQEQLQLLSSRLAELSAHLGPHIDSAHIS